MNSLFGGKQSNASQAPAYTGLGVQTSAQGLVIPIVYGMQRIPGNIIWYGNFKKIKHEQHNGGKGGAAGVTSTYTYTTGAALALCEGQISGIGKVWKNKDKVSGPIQVTATEYYTIGGTHVTVAHADTFVSDIGVRPKSVLEPPFERIYEGEPADGQYKCNNSGYYTFSATEPNNEIKIEYNYMYAPLTYTQHNGSASQTADSWLSGYSSGTYALSYRHTAYVIDKAWDLGSTNSMPSLSWEVKGKLWTSGNNDCNPADVIADFLTAEGYGACPGFPLTSLQNYWNYCQANGLFIAPIFNSQSPAADHISKIIEATHAAPVWNGSALNIVPRGDESKTGNGATYTPPDAVYDLTDDDFLCDEGEVPVTCTRKRQADTNNSIKVEYLDRDQDYNVAIAPAYDLASVIVHGERAKEPIQAHFICRNGVANLAAQLAQQRENIRNTYAFRLGWRFIGLDVMDLVTLTDSGLGLDQLLVRITEITENENGDLEINAEECPKGIGTASSMSSEVPEGLLPEYGTMAPDVFEPVFIEPPAELCNNPIAPELWIAISGGDNWGGCDIWVSEDDTSYKYFGRANNSARMGALTDTFPASSVSPDVTNILKVRLETDDQMLSGSQADADNLNTLCWVDGEYIAYKTAQLYDTNAYWLRDYIVRGAYNTTKGLHLTDSKFVRIDDTLIRYVYPTAKIGQTLYFKFISFNPQGLGKQTMSQVTVYPYTVIGTATENATELIVPISTLSASKNIIIKSDNGHRFQLGVNNNGILYGKDLDG